MNVQRRALIIAASITLSEDLLTKTEIVFDVDSEDEDINQTQKRKINRIKDYVEFVVPSYTAREFQSHFRVSRTAFETIVPLLRVEINIPRTGRPMLDLEKQVLAVLWLLATPDSFR